METFYASADRSAVIDIKRERALLKERLFILTILDSLPSIVLVLNKNRQAVFCNNNLLKQMGIPDDSQAIGQRPGEIFHCKNVENSPSGCGTSSFCRYCDAVYVILENLKGRQETRECQISVNRNGIHEVLELRVTGIPFSLDSEVYICFSITNINDEKRLNTLENLFIHDISNTVSVVQCITDLILRIDNKDEIKNLLVYLSQTTMQLTDEIHSHKQILMAEKGELKVQLSKIPSNMDLLVDLKNKYLTHECALKKEIVIDSNSKECSFTSDQTLLTRVLSNLIKNALEESFENDMIVIGSYLGSNNSIIFFVRNSQTMSEEVKAHLFQRTISTKGEHRGLGTYSIQLFTQNYLKGKISFTSEIGKGTIFYVEIPINYDQGMNT